MGNEYITGEYNKLALIHCEILFHFCFDFTFHIFFIFFLSYSFQCWLFSI